jgi:hypothetical protein
MLPLLWSVALSAPTVGQPFPAYEATPLDGHEIQAHDGYRVVELIRSIDW